MKIKKIAHVALAAHMPFAKVAGPVAVGLQGLGDGGFLRANAGPGLEGAVAIGRAPGEHTAARGGADGRCRMEIVEPDALLGERIEVRRLEVRMAVVSHVTPALIIRHDELVRRFVPTFALVSAKHVVRLEVSERSNGAEVPLLRSLLAGL